MAFRLHEALGTQNERYFVAATPPAHSLACLRIDDPVTAAAARLATGVGGLAPHRTGFAPAGRQTEFHDVIASSLPSDQPCLVAPCNNAPLVTHDTTRDANNRAEVSHQPTRQRERQMRGFTSSAHAQWFLHVHGIIHNLFRVGRHRLRSVHHRMLRARSFTVWAEVTAA